MRWAWHVACKRAKMNAYRILMGKSEGKRQLARLRCRWDYRIKRERMQDRGMEWIDLAEDMDQWRALLNVVMNLLVPSNFGKFLSG
jgi:hypothetical protein